MDLVPVSAILHKGEYVIPRGGIPHTHTEFVDGCFRCDLSRDETDDA